MVTTPKDMQIPKENLEEILALTEFGLTLQPKGMSKYFVTIDRIVSNDMRYRIRDTYIAAGWSRVHCVPTTLGYGTILELYL